MILTFYIVATIVGFGMVLAGLLGAHGHGDGPDHDFDHGHDHDGGHGDAWIPFFSLKFWTYFLAGSGIVGLLLTYVARTPEFTGLPVSLVTGLVCGLLVSYLMRLLRKHEANSLMSENELIGHTAKVLVGIRGEQQGRIRVEIKGEIIDMLARSNEQAVFEPGEEVVIMESAGNSVIVTSKEQLLK